MAQAFHGLDPKSTPNKAEGKNDLPERTKAFALAVIRMADDLQRTTSSIVLGKQGLRSATSIGANYREASRGRSNLNGASGTSDIDGRAAQGSGKRVGDERINLLRQSAPLLDECRHLIAILVTIAKRARENK